MGPAQKAKDYVDYMEPKHRCHPRKIWMVFCRDFELQLNKYELDNGCFNNPCNRQYKEDNDYKNVTTVKPIIPNVISRLQHSFVKGR